ncbi:hypothetical protein HAX54_038838 [Datura stramonium]|uniref:C2 domain-containing protein n=1 Tax=Datura stramonium TaxID=4076 RepID=A0ABS8VPB0_DATST|nr:hypothetical protein [Datura stramonium]
MQSSLIDIFAEKFLSLISLKSILCCPSQVHYSLDPCHNNPHVDFGLRLLGADLMSIPGLYRFVQPGSFEIFLYFEDCKHICWLASKETIKDQVANMYLWPKTLEVPILDPSKLANMRRWSMSVIPLKDLTPDESKTMTLDLLKNMDANDAQNDKNRGQIMQVKKNRDPRWGEEFTFVLEEAPVNDRLHMEEILGYVDINLSDVVSNKGSNEKYHLIDSKNGRLQVELQWRTAS